MKIKDLFATRKRITVAAVTGAVLAGAAGVAFAYFPVTGTGTGVAKTGTAATLTVSFVGATGGPLEPGQPTSDQTLTFQIHNSSSNANAFVTSLSATVTTSGGDVVTFTTKAAAPGCASKWYSATVTTSTPLTIAKGGNYATVHVTVAMDTTSVQTACEGVSPVIHLTAS